MKKGNNSSNHFSVRRIMTELKELKKNPSEEFSAAPISGNIFEIHFTMKGPPDTAFEKGYYHGKLILPSRYPFKPPDLMMLTPNGRFETNKKICLNVTSFHKELWKPGWGIRTIIMALVGFFPQSSEGIGSIKYSSHVREKLALESRDWSCSCCKRSNTDIMKILKKQVSRKKKRMKKKKRKEESENVEEGEEEETVTSEKNEEIDSNNKKKGKKKKKKKQSKKMRKRKSSKSRKRKESVRRRIPILEEDESLTQKILNVFLTLVLLSVFYGVVRFGFVGGRV